MGDLGSALSSGLSGLGSGLSSAAGGIGSTLGDLGSALSGVSPADAATGVSSADVAQTAFDPTGSIGAQESINPPGSGSSSSIGGTQSGGASSSSSGQGTQQNQQNQQYAAPAAVNSLKKALQQLSQQRRQNPWLPPAQPEPQGVQQAARLPTLNAQGQPAPSSVAPPTDPDLARAAGNFVSPAEPPAEEQADLPPATPPTMRGVPDAPAAPAVPIGGGPGNEMDPKGYTGTPAAPAPSTTGGKPTPPTDDQGRQITVRKAPPAQPSPGQPSPAQPAVAVPTKKPGVEQPPTGPPQQPGPIMRDVTGGQSVPSALPQLARAALGMLLPLVLSGAFSGGRRGGRGGFRHFGGFHHGGEGHWPYHHPMRGWQMHDRHPGGGWRPIHPRHFQEMLRERANRNDQTSQILQAIFSNSQQGQENQQQFGGAQQDGGGNAVTSDQRDAPTTEFDASKVPQGPSDRGTPGVSAAQYDQFARNYASQIGLNPDVVSRVLATESNFGQNVYGDYENDKPTSFGGFQLHLSADGNAMGNQYMRDTGHAPWNPKYWQEQTKYALDKMKQGGLAPWDTTRKKLGYDVWAARAAPVQVASAPATSQLGPEAMAQ